MSQVKIKTNKTEIKYVRKLFNILDEHNIKLHGELSCKLTALIIEILRRNK